jgi:predicted transposase YbfD/YdcC
MKTAKGSVLEYLNLVEDPRVRGRCLHKLIDVLAIAICARIAGAETFEEMEEFWIHRAEWLGRFLELRNGIPSHDTIRRVFSIVDPAIMEIAFRMWVEGFRASRQPERISLDGKSVKGTNRRFNDSSRPLILVNVYDHEQGICLGQEVAPSTGNAETGAAMELLPWMNLKQTLVSVDAGLGRAGFLERLREKKADYIVPVKCNARGNFNELQELMRQSARENNEMEKTDERGHGRVERRECFASTRLVEELSEKFRGAYPGVKTIIEVHRERETKDHRFGIQESQDDGTTRYRKNENQGQARVDTQTALFVSSRAMSPLEALAEIRAHWAIENKLHWSLDVVFGEDACRVRDKAIATNLAMIRKIAFNLMQTGPGKGSKNLKMKRACWSLDYLEELLLVDRA